MTERRLIVVSHTHWDREWYHTAARFLQRLVPLIDGLLERPPSEGSFLLDGQAILLQDYLTVRPERAATLHAHLAAGRLEAGPWYVLADNLLPSGEAIVRNLEAGRRVLRRLGGTPLSVAYCPDTFGHPAALPTIAQGFGLDVAILWRGLGGRSDPATDTMRWRGADESCVLVHHLPPDGYEFGSSLPGEVAASRFRWQRMHAVLSARNRTGLMLLLNGADHHAPQPQTADRIARLAWSAARDHVNVVHGSLSQFARELHAVVEQDRLPELDGELRDSYGYTWTLQGTFAMRAAQKRRNAHLERALLRDVEPWLALAWLQRRSSSLDFVSDGRITLAHAPALLAHAWETLLRTHPHDTLCGCSIDAVARAMDVRQESVREQIHGLRQAMLQLALAHDVVVARSRGDAHGHQVIVRNRTASARAGLAEVRLLTRIGDVRVGPESAGQAYPNTRAEPLAKVNALLTQHLGTRIRHERLESPQHYPDDDAVRVESALVWIPETAAIPAFGVRVLPVYAARQTSSQEAVSPRPVVANSAGRRRTLDNGILQVAVIGRRVSISLAGRTWRNALSLDSTMDVGDSYTPSLCGTPTALRLVGARVVARGPLRAAIRLSWELPSSRSVTVPSDVESLGARPARVPRDSTSKSVRVQTTLTLDAESPYVRCDIRGVNHRRDHRLRMCWHTDVRAEVVWADAAFGPVNRSRVLHARPEDQTRHELAHMTSPSPITEAAPSTMPMHRWLSVSATVGGAALLSDGLAEAEVNDNTMAITLVRAIAELSRHDLPERPGHAGWPSAIPRAQSLGAFRASVAVMPHAAWDNAVLQHIEDACDAFLLPLTGETWRDYAGSVQWLSGPALSGDGLQPSCVTVSTEGDALVLRAVNVRNEATRGAWTMPDDGPWVVTRCRMDQTPMSAPTVLQRSIVFEAGARAVITYLVHRAPS